MSVRDRKLVGSMKRTFRGFAYAACVLVAAAAALPARAEFDETSPRATFAGRHDYVVTGGTLRTSQTSVGTDSTAWLTGIPEDATILKAYLYWGGSGNSVDDTVTFGRQGVEQVVTALEEDRFETSVTETGTIYRYFGGVSDVTDIVDEHRNNVYRFTDLSVSTGNPWNGKGAVVAGWALVVVYSHEDEPYRYTRVYDGLEGFISDSVTTTQTGFRVPAAPVQGKVTTVTWEGDSDLSSNERLTFDGFLLSDTCGSAADVFNSRWYGPTSATTYGCVDTSGVDIDTFNISDLLHPGQRGAELVYRADNDLVVLTAQVISTTNTPVADLGIVKTADQGEFIAGENGSYTIRVYNDGPEDATGRTKVTDQLPAGLSFVSGAGEGWSCQSAGQEVTCFNDAEIRPGEDLPTLTLTVAVDGNAVPAVENTAVVSHPLFDDIDGNNQSTVTVPVRGSDLSDSGKEVADLNGGDVEPGDRLRYTITLIEASGEIDATDVSVVDDLAPNVRNLQVVQLPEGAIDRSVASGGAHGTGQLNVSGITVPRGESVQIIFDVVVSPDAEPGEVIANTARVSNGSGPGRVLYAPELEVVIEGRSAPSGNKILYLHNSGTPILSRIRPPEITAAITLTGTQEQTWTLDPAIPPGQALVLPREIAVRLRVFCTGTLCSQSSNSVTVTLERIRNGETTILGSSGPELVRNVAIEEMLFPITLGEDVTLEGEDRLSLRIQRSGGVTTGVVVYQYSAGHSLISFETPTVINVDAVTFHTAPYPSSDTSTTWKAGDALYIRAVVSDPFGDYDIPNPATLTLRDAAGNVLLSNVSMEARHEDPDDPAIKIFEYVVGDDDPFVIPNDAAIGSWTATVTAHEGEEGTVWHTKSRTFQVMPSDGLRVTKSHNGDFTAGAEASYTLLVFNESDSPVNGPTTVTDVLPTGLKYVSAEGDNWTCDADGQTVICTSSEDVAAEGSMSPITLTVQVAGNLGDSIDNQAFVSNPSVADGEPVPGNIDTAIIRHPDLSTSTKEVLDLNGGDANPGDTLRYTITVTESAGYDAHDVTVTDVLQTGLQGLTGLNASLSTCNGTAAVSGNTLTVTGLSLAGNLSCKLVFEVTVSGFVESGHELRNTAVITNPNGPGATPSAPPVVVLESQHEVIGGKVLYIYAGGTLSREPQGEDNFGTPFRSQGGSVDFVLEPALQAPLIITPGSTVQVSVFLEEYEHPGYDRVVHAQLLRTEGVNTIQIGTDSNKVTFTPEVTQDGDRPDLLDFFITMSPSGAYLDQGEKLVLRIVNGDALSDRRTLRVRQLVDNERSTVRIQTNTVIHVEELTVHAAEDPSAPPKDFYDRGEEVRIRAIVSDPFGYADITGGTLTIRNPSGTIVSTIPVSNDSHTVEDETSGATRTYEVEYTISEEAPHGIWTVSFTAFEGTEGEISHTANAVFVVGNPEPVLPLTVEKTVRVISDPVNGTDNPKAIPGAIMEYEITITNPNASPVDADSVFVRDPIPAQVALRVSDIEEPGSGPVSFTDGSPSSGLTYEFPSHLAFSSDNGASWDYEPVEDSNGTDPEVTDIRINPQGEFKGENSQFTLKFRVMIK